MKQGSQTVQAPNTKLESRFLSSDVIICCGEDEGEVKSALSANKVQAPLEEFGFRSYKYLKWPGFTVLLAAIGTGSLEPLLYELLVFGIAKRIVLVGTAGRTPKSQTELGNVYAINKAYLAGTGLDREIASPVDHNFHLLDSCEVASIVSTDFYYGFKSPSPEDGYQQKLGHLAKDIAKYINEVDLVDMEVAQFYTFCRLMSNLSNVEFVAIKGPANALSAQEDQNSNAPKVLHKAFSAAFDVLGILPDENTTAI